MSDEQWVPGNKSELMSTIRREWNLLMDVVAGLEKAGKLTTPDAGGWSPKDNLAHLAEWMDALMGYHMDKHPPEKVMGLSKDQTRAWDMEVINPVLFERNKNRSMEEVMDHLKQTYDELIKKLDATPFDELLIPRHADDPEKRPLLLWVLGNTSDHFTEHRETMEKML